MSDFNGVPAEDDVPVVETSGDAWNDAMVEDESPIAAPESLSGAPTISTPLPPPPPKVKSRRTLRALALAFAVVAVGFGGGILGTIAVDEWNINIGSTRISGSSNSPLVTSEVDSDDPSLGTTVVAQVVNQLADSVVTINSQISDATGEGEASGTGVVLTSDGEILTNAHVVEGATGVTVRFAGETEPRTATVLASDAGNDLALLKIDATNLKPATFAQPGTIRIGDQVIAIGYALALDGGPSVTSGIISALKRTIITESGALNGLIQTDAAISSGNSGGPLVNFKGEVVGINTAVARGDNSTAANNIGFAVSTKEVLRVVELLRKQANGETRKEGYLGVGLTDRDDGGQGAVIANVQSGSPAAQAGVKEGDVILAINDEPITGRAGMIAIVRDALPDETITMKLERGKEIITVKATLTERTTTG